MIIDTNALSAIANKDPTISAVLGRGRLTIPVIVLGEYRFGLLQSRHRAVMLAWLARFAAACAVASADEETVPHYAAIRLELKKKGQPIPANDLWIAALARQHRLPIVSRDGHFDAVTGVERLTW